MTEKRKLPGKRVTSVARARELRQFLKEVAALCWRYSFRIEADVPYSDLAVFDERDHRPAIFPVAAFAKSISRGRVRELKMQSILPHNLRQGV